MKVLMKIMFLWFIIEASLQRGVERKLSYSHRNRLSKGYYTNKQVMRRNHQLSMGPMALQLVNRKNQLKQFKRHNRMQVDKIYQKYKNLTNRIKREKQIRQQYQYHINNRKQIYVPRAKQIKNWQNRVNQRINNLKSNQDYFKKTGLQQKPGIWQHMGNAIKKSFYNHIPARRKAVQIKNPERQLNNILTQFKQIFKKKGLKITDEAKDLKNKQRQLSLLKKQNQELMEDIMIESDNIDILNDKERKLTKENEVLKTMNKIQYKQVKRESQNRQLLLQNDSFVDAQGAFVLTNFDPTHPILYHDFLTGAVKASDPRPIVIQQYSFAKSLEYLTVVQHSVDACYSYIQRAKINYKQWSTDHQTQYCLTDYYYEFEIMRNVFLQLRYWMQQILPQQVNFQGQIYSQTQFIQLFIDQSEFHSDTYIQQIYTQINTQNFLNIFQQNQNEIYTLLRIYVENQNGYDLYQLAKLTEQPQMTQFLVEFHNALLYIVNLYDAVNLNQRQVVSVQPAIIVAQQIQNSNNQQASLQGSLAQSLQESTSNQIIPSIQPQIENSQASNLNTQSDSRNQFATSTSSENKDGSNQVTINHIITLNSQPANQVQQINGSLNQQSNQDVAGVVNDLHDKISHQVLITIPIPQNLDQTMNGEKGEQSVGQNQQSGDLKLVGELNAISNISQPAHIKPDVPPSRIDHDLVPQSNRLLNQIQDQVKLMENKLQGNLNPKDVISKIKDKLDTVEKQFNDSSYKDKKSIQLQKFKFIKLHKWVFPQQLDPSRSNLGDCLFIQFALFPSQRDILVNTQIQLSFHSNYSLKRSSSCILCSEDWFSSTHLIFRIEQPC